MKAFTAFILATLIVSISISASPVYALGEPLVGVKDGDWIEYNITVTGTGQAPPTHDVRWMRLQAIEVECPAFSVNVTSRYANGTVGSAVWKFNFTEGNVGGWIIIPANLPVGDTFYDSSIHNHKPVNVIIQNQEQKTVLGAIRTVTYGNDSFRHKEWDMATGVFVGSSETYRNVTNKDGWYIDNLTVTVDAVATNLWSAEVRAPSQSMFYPLVIAVVLAAAVLSAVIVVARRRHVVLNPKQQTIAGIVLVLGLIFAVGVISSTPISESQVPLSFRDINVIVQTLWMSLLFVSMWFRKKGNYLMHGILAIMVVSITIVSFLGVLVMSPMDNSSMHEYFGSPVDMAVFLGHAIFSFPALAFGVWLILLWRPNSPTFPSKSRRIAWLLTVFWVLSYIVGILDYLIIRNHLF
jgi:uncharacterized membrane protein YozB (DUF420 family)